MSRHNAFRSLAVTADLPPIEEVQVRLRAAGYPSVAAWATRPRGRRRPHAVSTVWSALTRHRTSQLSMEILAELAADIGMTPDELESLLTSD